MSQIVVIPPPVIPPVIVAQPAPTVIQVSGASVAAYTHQQSVASATWTITHKLGFKPGGIIVFDSAGSLWIPDGIQYPDNNSIIISFGNAGFAGVAYIS